MNVDAKAYEHRFHAKHLGPLARHSSFLERKLLTMSGLSLALGDEERNFARNTRIEVHS